MRSSLLVSVLGAVTSVYSQGGCSGECGNAHDPAVIRRDDGTYVRFSTGGGISVYTAKTIFGPWLPTKNYALPGGSRLQSGTPDLWAPYVYKDGNTFYLYYSVSTFGTQNSVIGVATSTDLVTWADQGTTGIFSERGSPYNAIDGSLYSVGSKYFMTFGSFWSGLYTIEMANPPLKIRAGATPTNIAHKDNDRNAKEAPFIVKNGDYYYLFFSAGQCCQFDPKRLPPPGAEYHIQVCRSTNPTGGFFDKDGTSCLQGGGTTILGSDTNKHLYAPGGQGVYDDPVQGLILYYHYVDTKIGYRDDQKVFGASRLKFVNGWPVVYLVE